MITKSLTGLTLRTRIDKLRNELAARGLDAFIAVQNARYLSGTTAATAVIVSGEEETLLCNRLELERAKREGEIRNILAYNLTRAPLRRGERVRFREFWQLAADYLQEIGARAIAFDNIKFGILRRLRHAYAANYREMPELVLELRKIKSGREIAWLRKSAALAMKGMRCISELIEVGRTELEVAAEVEYEMRKAGSEGTPFSTIVASGRNSWLPHATATQKKLRRGELVVVDLGATYNGYASDVTRTFALAPTQRQLKLMEVVRRVQRVALAKVKDGAKASGVDEAARMVAARAGYVKFYLHGTGHGIGLDTHEPPSLTPESKDVLYQGMVTTVEPGVYVPRVGGARLEDMVLVTKDGRKVLTTASRMSVRKGESSNV